MKAKRIIFLLFFVLFIAVFPLATVYFFSKSGLDLHKVIKSDMAFHQDSIRINLGELVSIGEN